MDLITHHATLLFARLLKWMQSVLRRNGSQLNSEGAALLEIKARPLNGRTREGLNELASQSRGLPAPSVFLRRRPPITSAEQNIHNKRIGNSFHQKYLKRPLT